MEQPQAIPSPREKSRPKPNRQPVGTDLIIVGGGILGLSTACEVLAQGLSVIVFEEDPKRSATWTSAGMLSPYAETPSTGALQDMMRAARTAYPAYLARIEEHSSMRIEMGFPGTLIPSLEPDQEERLRGLAQRLKESGARCRYLDSEEAIWEEPQLGPCNSGAVLLEDEGYVNPRSLHMGLRAAFERLGGQWIGLQVLGMISRQGAVAGVESAVGVTRAGAVINAAGAWADRFLMPEDQERYQVRPIRGQTVRLRPTDRHEGIRRVIQVPGQGYLVPHADGSVIVGSTSEDVGPFAASTAGGVHYVLNMGRRLVPASAGWRFLAPVSGLRPMAANGELFLEPDSSRRGLFHGLGLYRQGILLAPVAATRLARLAVEYLGRKGA